VGFIERDTVGGEGRHEIEDEYMYFYLETWVRFFSRLSLFIKKYIRPDMYVEFASPYQCRLFRLPLAAREE
jgi:hypothetical protein